jgi:mannose-1-phosphate guanylyltransferase
VIRAYLIAGGLGMRLRARLGSQPKALVALGDTTLLDAQLEWLLDCGVNEVVLALGVRAQPVVNRIRVRGAQAMPKVSWTVDPVPLGTAGALALAARDEKRTFLAVDGSVLAELDLVALLDLHRERAAEVTLALYRAEEGAPAAELDKDGRVLALAVGGAREPWTPGGIALCEPSLLALVPRERPSDLEAEILPAAVAAGRAVYGLLCRGRRFVLDTPESVDRAARGWPPLGGGHS